MSLDKPPKAVRSTSRFVVRHDKGEGQEVRFHTNSLTEARSELARIAASSAVGSTEIRSAERMARTWTPGRALPMPDGSSAEISEFDVSTAKRSPSGDVADEWAVR